MFTSECRDRWNVRPSPVIIGGQIFRFLFCIASPVLIGPVFSREAAVAPRRVRHYVMRTVYGLFLLLITCTLWMILAGTQQIRNIGDMARFGTVLFQILAPLQLALIMFLSAVQSASNIAIEKDRQTLILLLMSRLTNSELVLGKLFASLLNIGVMLLTSLPIFMLIVLFGGTSFEQVGWTFAVTVAAAIAAGALGATIALWREKTFQTLALVLLAIVIWIGFFEGVGLTGQGFAGFSGNQIAAATNPLRAVLAACDSTIHSTWPRTVAPFLVVAGVVSVMLSLVAIIRVRRWNPNREVRLGQQVDATQDVDVFTGKVSLDDNSTDEEKNVDRSMVGGTHIDDRSRKVSQTSRRVWDNPILWRETCTWAYGRKILFIRAVYWAMAIAVFIALWSMVDSGLATRTTADEGVKIPVVAKALAPLGFVSLVMINALAVTSITSERDGRALDLLRVTDISPTEFLFGKWLGILFVSIDMLLLPLLMCVYLWFHRVVSLENLVYLGIGFSVIALFVSALGIHAGMSNATSRQAIAVSLGTVFFLFLGVVTSMVMMVSFTGNVEAQLAPFLACIVGGAIGLYVALGWNMQSSALAVASLVLPITMFYCITSLLLERYLGALLAVTFAYGFATTAIVIPRLSEFLVYSGQSKVTQDG